MAGEAHPARVALVTGGSSDIGRACRSRLEAAGLTVVSGWRTTDPGGPSVRFDVTVWITENTEGLEITWTFRSELFEAATIARLNDHYETLLRSVVEHPEARIDSLEIWSAAERQRRVGEDQAWRQDQASKLSLRRRKAVGGLA